MFKIFIILSFTQSIYAQNSLYNELLKNQQKDLSAISKYPKEVLIIKKDSFRRPASITPQESELNKYKVNEYHRAIFLSDLEDCYVKQYKNKSFIESQLILEKGSYITGKRLNSASNFFIFKIEQNVYLTPLICVSPLD